MRAKNCRPAQHGVRDGMGGRPAQARANRPVAQPRTARARPVPPSSHVSLAVPWSVARSSLAWGTRPAQFGEAVSAHPGGLQPLTQSDMRNMISSMQKTHLSILGAWWGSSIFMTNGSNKPSLWVGLSTSSAANSLLRVLGRCPKPNLLFSPISDELPSNRLPLTLMLVEPYLPVVFLPRLWPK